MDRDTEHPTEELTFVAEEIAEIVELARRSMVPKIRYYDILEGGKLHKLTVVREGVGPLTVSLESGEKTFYHFSFKVSDIWEKYSVVVFADMTANFLPVFHDTKTLLLRTDSGCETGQVFGDITCECKDQLLKCMERIAELGEGMVINIPRQDGRGMGLPFKLATLLLQKELGVDTVEAASMLEPSPRRDVRTYAGVVAILKFFQIPTTTCIILLTNNEKKESVLRENGYTVKDEGLVIPPNRHTLRHLKAKQEKLGHRRLLGESFIP